MAALFSWLRALSNNPVTVGGAAIIFVISLAVIAVGIAIYLVSERRTNKHSDREGIDNKESVHHKWSIPVLGIVVILLGAWNLSLQRRVRNLEVETVRYVMPRQLTKEQIIAFGKYLSSHAQPHEVRIKYILGDGEAKRYATDFASAFHSGNWLPNMMPIDPALVTCHISPPRNVAPISCSTELEQMANSLEGASIRQTGPNLPPPSTLEEKINPPPELLQIVSEGLKAAGIPQIGGSYSNNSDPLNTITVFVGRRPRDKWSILPPKFSERQRSKFPDDISDDDF